MKKRLWATILVLCMALGMLPGTAWAASIVRYGECGTEGDNLTYTLDSEGKLTISGKGALKNDFGPHLEASIHPNGEWTAIKTVEFEDGVTSIGNDAFTQCYGLRSVTIPSSITTIGRRAFSDCSSLTSINIPNSVTSIGDGAFGNCSSLTSVNIPNGITSIGSGVFGGCSSLTNINIPNGVTSIGSGAFSGCSSLTNINIPSGVTGIGSGAFQSCTGLTNINIPNGVTSIGSSAFNGCNSLVSINIPNSVPTIEYSTFQNCTSLTSINVPNSVTSIERWAFSGCTSLTSVTIPDSVTTIKDSAFEDCTSLTSINIPNSVTSIGHYLGGAFAGCTSLTSATIPDSVTSIRDVFAGCTNLTSVTIQKGVTSIKDGCFSDCTRLTSVTIPDSVTVIGGSAFWRCTNLTSVTIPSSVTTIGDSAFSSSGLTSIIIPNSVTTIGEDAFSSTDLTNIIIPNSITNISDSAFCACASLSNVTIPNSVTTIGTNAFSACTKLTDVYYTGIKSQWEAIKIGNYNDCLTSATIHYNSVGPDIPDTPSGGSIIRVSFGAGDYLGGYMDDSSYVAKKPTISDSGDTVYLPAGATDIDLAFSIPNMGGIIFSDGYIIDDERLNSNLILIEGNCGLTAEPLEFGDTEALIAFDGTARPGSLDITCRGFALEDNPGQLLVDKDGHLLTSNTLHVLVQDKDTPDTPSETGVRVDFFPNGGTITSIKGYTRDQIMQGDPSVPDDILFIDVNSGIAGMMTDENGIISDFPVVEREGYTFDGWWYTDDRDVIYSAYDNEITDFTGMRRVDLSTNFASLADSFGRNVIAKWNKNTGDTDNTHEVWFHWNGGRVTSVLGVSTDHMIYGTLYDSNGNWIYAEGQDEDPSEILGMMITDKSGKLAGLPVIEREGYTFTGWYTMENGGNKITADYTFTGAGQYGRDYLWAHWVPSTDQPGDLTGDNKVTMADVLRLARGAAGYVVLTEQEQKAGDVTGDGKITMADVIRVARYAAGYSPTV